MTRRPASTQRLRILALGYVVRYPVGGVTWSNLQYLLGLMRLGHDVFFLDDSDDYVSCYDPRTDAMSSDPAFGLAYAADAFARIGLGERWAYYDEPTGRWLGAGADRALAACREADLLINVYGAHPLRDWLRDVPVRVLIDQDPAFTQVANCTDAKARERSLRHNRFFTFGENFGRPGCRIPDDGLPWRPTRHPVCLDAVPVTAGRPAGRYTTVLAWQSYASPEYRGVRYGQKSDSFRDLLDLPGRCRVEFELAVGGPATPRGELEARGWHPVNPLVPSRDPWTYLDYMAASKAEFTVAKQGYVVSRSGWFSERSATYLASGRPVVTQQTGFSDWLQADAGVLPFGSADEAAGAIADVEAHYARHCAAARAVAERCFDARTVLSDLLEAALGAQPAAGVAAPRNDRQGRIEA